MVKIIEVRAAEGGDDAKLFAHDLANAYIRFLDSRGWLNRAEFWDGGAEIESQDIDGLDNEAGGHRIQRVPPTERRGRVHTSTVTVSVLSESEATKPVEGYSVRWFSGTGKGGQHRNKHQNCCEITHNATGLKRIGADSRSRISNYRDAMSAVEQDINAAQSRKTHKSTNAVRKAQIGSGMRGDKRRTYRFQDDSVVDHFTGKKASASIVMKGNFDRLW